MLLGVHNEPSADVRRAAEKFAVSEVERPFVSSPIPAQDLIAKFEATACKYVKAGQTVVWSFKPLPADVASGAWKPHVEQFARYLQVNEMTDRVIVVIWHEPENDIPKWFRNAAEFVKLFNTVHDWLTAIEPSIQTSHAALGYFYRNLTAAQARQWVTKCTVHSIDLYSGRTFPLSMTLKDSKAYQTWKASRPAGSKLGVSERGFIAAPEKSAERVAAIDAEADYLASLPPEEHFEFYIIWNTPGTEKDPTIVLDDAAIDAVNRMFARLAQPVPCPLCQGTGQAERGTTYTIVRVSA